MNFVVLVVVAQDVADVLAEEALDALAEFLHAVDVLLLHAPGAVRRVRRARGLNFLIFFLTRKFHETSVTRSRMRGKRAHRLDGDRLVDRDHVEPRHAHQARLAVDFRRARAALAGLAVPAAGEVVRLRGLDLVDDVEHDHALGGLGLVIDELAGLAFFARTPDAESDCRSFCHLLNDRLQFLRHRRESVRGATSWSHPRPFQTTKLTFAASALLSGKSSRKWPPRLSLRSRADSAMASEMVSRCFRSSAVCQPGLYSRWP